MAPNGRELNSIDYKIYRVTQQREYELQVNNIGEIKQRLVGKAAIRHLNENIHYLGEAGRQNRLLHAFSVTFLPKISKSVDVCRS